MNKENIPSEGVVQSDSNLSEPLLHDTNTGTDVPQNANLSVGTDPNLKTEKATKVRKARAPRKKKSETPDTSEQHEQVMYSVPNNNLVATNSAIGEYTQSIEISHAEIPEHTETPEELIDTKRGAFHSIFEKTISIIKKFRPTEAVVFTLCTAIALYSGIALLGSLNAKYSTELPTHGGTYTEGVVGYARFINPILGYTDADKDMISLIYSGLLKPTPDGEFVADLAKSWTISDDGLVYDFILKDNIFFHDGKPVTTDDIEFTIQKALDPQIKSPKAENWAGVKVEKISSTEIRFTLKKPYAPFLENMTLGILPKHIWSEIGHEAFDVHIRNREPIGSGPFKVKKAVRNDSGIYESYELTAFNKYALGKPYIDTYIVTFYKNEDDALKAYSAKKIDGLGSISPDEATRLKEDGFSITSTSLPRVFGLFFNQSSAPVLVHKEVREALNVSIDRFALIHTILNGWGTVARSPIPGSLSVGTEIQSSTQATTTDSVISQKYIDAGKEILIAKGWKQNQDGIFEKQTKSGKTTTVEKLSFSISTSNAPELKRSAEILKETWTKMGADVRVEIFEPSDLTQKVIRPREYNSLLFGNVVGRDFDLYPFWHSSQRNDPGLNIALYTNIKADKALETIRTTSDASKKLEQYRIFETEVQNDIPALFLYSPDFIYATANKVHNLTISNITSPSERFMNVHTWYIETEKVWNIFAKQTLENN